MKKIKEILIFFKFFTNQKIKFLEFMKKVVYKIVVAGDAGVGKTTMIHRYTKGEFIDTTSMTIGVEFVTKKVAFSDIICMLQIWDIGGQDRFRFLVKNYLRGAHGALLLFDTTSMTSFVNIQKWYQLIRKESDNIPIVLVGTKKDLEEFSMVADFYAKKTQEKFGMIDYVKTSSKLNVNIDKAFNVLIEYLINKGF